MTTNKQPLANLFEKLFYKVNEVMLEQLLKDQTELRERRQLYREVYESTSSHKIYVVYTHKYQQVDNMLAKLEILITEHTKHLRLPS